MINFALDEYLIQLERLVNIDSGSRVPGGTDQIADYFEEKYKKLGLHVMRRQTVSGLGPCLEIRNRPERHFSDILFMGHMDTVFPEGTAGKCPYKREGALAYGPGVMDMKAGLLSTYYLVKNLLENQIDISMCIALNSDEEISSVHSRDWITDLARNSAYAFVMEPGRRNGEYVSERKGLARYIVDVKGVQAHAGIAPWDGASAIHELAGIIGELAELNDYDAGTSVNVGTVEGGTSANVVSEFASCQVDARFDKTEECERIERVLNKLKNNPADDRIKICVSRAGFRPPMQKTEKTEWVLALLKEKGKALGMDVKWVKTGGGSDGNFAASAGCTVVDGAGPAGDKAHSQYEVLQIDTVEPRLRLLYETIVELTEKARVM